MIFLSDKTAANSEKRKGKYKNLYFSSLMRYHLFPVQFVFAHTKTYIFSTYSFIMLCIYKSTKIFVFVKEHRKKLDFLNIYGVSEISYLGLSPKLVAAASGSI